MTMTPRAPSPSLSGALQRLLALALLAGAPACSEQAPDTSNSRDSVRDDAGSRDERDPGNEGEQEPDARPSKADAGSQSDSARPEADGAIAAERAKDASIRPADAASSDRPGDAGGEQDSSAADGGPSTPSDDFVEDHRAECTIAPLPSVQSLKENPKLPDPFTMLDGTKVTTKQQWKCRREEIGAMLEHYELGEKPRAPERVSGSISGETFTVKVTDRGKTISFTVALKKPAGAGPFPAIIGYSRVNLGGGLAGLNVATIDYTAANFFDAGAPNQIAKDGASYRGQGIFYDLYGKDHSAGALMAWAWGASRIIDALIATPEAGIDPKRIAVTGCSRFGKGALVAGAFDQRIALTIPQEAGSGGCSAWRAIAWQKSLGNDIEQLSNLAGGSNWFRADFGRNFSDATSNRIPFDHHQLEGMVAPRALLNVEQSGVAWLGPGASYVNNVAARELFTALGAEQAHTYSMSAGHEHCTLPQSQYHWVQSYVKKYLLNQAGEPAAIEAQPGYTFDRAKWIDWETPRLQ